MQVLVDPKKTVHVLFFDLNSVLILVNKMSPDLSTLVSLIVNHLEYEFKVFKVQKQQSIDLVEFLDF